MGTDSLGILSWSAQGLARKNPDDSKEDVDKEVGWQVMLLQVAGVVLLERPVAGDAAAGRKCCASRASGTCTAAGAGVALVLLQVLAKP